MTLEEKGFRKMLRQRGRDLKLTAGEASEMGKTLRGTINRIGAFDLTTDTAKDPRGRRILETPADVCPDIGDQNELQDLKNRERFKVVDIGLDGPDYSKKFALLQLTPQDT